MTDEKLVLWFGMMSRMTHMIKRAIADHYGGLMGLWNTSEAVLRDELTRAQADTILENRSEQAVDAYLKRLEEKKISHVWQGHECYPANLTHIPDAPTVLFVCGSPELLRRMSAQESGPPCGMGFSAVSGQASGSTPCIAVVGARKASPYGIAMSDRIAEKLAANGVCIVSGMALGIDGAAHRAALRVGGATAAVLGCGINVPYPRENYNLYHDMCRNGVIVSEYGLDVKPDAFRFPHRNRIISGMADGVLVVEAKERSGSLITADQALEQGREVYAVPGRATDPASVGCNNLLRQGALCATDADDILQSIMPGNTDESECSDIHRTVVQKNLLAPDEKKVYSCVRLEPGHVDDICLEAGISVSEATQILYELEKKKLIKQLIRNYFVRAL